MTGTLRVLTVCSHNRTRSVMMAALLAEHAGRQGLELAVRSSGVRAVDGASATDRAQRMLAARSIDVSGHRSAPVRPPDVNGAHLVLCAEQDHVVWIAGRFPGSFPRCFTLPEAVRLGESIGPRTSGPNHPVPAHLWIDRLAEHRQSPLDYLDATGGDIGELHDPTGRSPVEWDASFAEIDRLTRRLVELLA